MTDYGFAVDDVLADGAASATGADSAANATLPPSEAPRNRYTDAVADIADEHDSRIKLNILAATNSNPDDVAKANRLAKEFGGSPELFLRLGKDMEHLDYFAKLQKEVFGADTLKDQMADPIFAKSVVDDLDSFSQIDARIKQWGELKAWEPPEPTIGNILWGLYRSFDQGLDGVRTGLNQQASDFFTWLGITDNQNKSSADYWYRQRLKRDREQLLADIRSTTPQFESQTGQAVYDTTSGIVRQAPAIALSLLTRSAIPMAAAGGLETEAEAYSKYMSRGSSPAASFLGAAGEGSIGGVLDRFAAGKFFKGLGVTKFATSLGELIGREVPLAQVETFAQDMIDTAIANPDKSWSDFLSERKDRGYQTLISSLTQLGLFSGMHLTANGGTKTELPRMKAEETVSAAGDLMRITQGSKLHKRDPDSFQAAIQEMTERRHVGELYISSDAFLNAMTGSGIDGAAILRQMPSVAGQLATMPASDGEIRIPTGELLRAVSGSGAEDAVLPHLRPYAQELGSAQLEQSPTGDGASSSVGALKPGQVSVAPGQDHLEAIRDTAAEVLKANGLRAKEAEATAAIVAIRAQDRARRLGMDPVELYNEKPLQRADVDSTAEISSGKTLLQAMNAGVDLDQPVRIVSVQPRNWSGEPKAAKIAKFWKSVYGGQNVTIPGLGKASISAKDLGHAISSFKKSVSTRAHFDVLAALPEMLEHAVVVESYPDAKGKSGISMVHRVFAAASIGERTYAVKLTVLERSDGTRQVDFDDQFRFYDYHVPKEVLTSEQAMAPDVSNPSAIYLTGAAAEPGPHNISEGSLSLRDLLSGLNDDYGDPYFQSGRDSNPSGSVNFTDSGPNNRDLSQNSKVLLNLKGDELAPAESDIETLRTAAMAYYDTLRASKPAVSSDIGDVSFVRRGKLKVKSFSGDPLKLKVLPAIRDVIEKGIYEGREQLHKERKDGIVAFHKFSGNVTLGNRLVRIEVLVAEDRNGNKHYDLFANYENEEGDAVATRRQMRSGASPSKAGEPTYEQSIGSSFDSINIRILNGDEVPAGRNSRGSVTFTDSGPIIRFFQSHDASTAIHELSHVWLEELRSDAMRPNAPQQLRDDWAEAQRYLQLGELAQDVLIPTDAHETFARTGEAYFREGRAPSPQLVGILNQFRDWIRAIYRNLRQLDVEMTPEIRGVFDRLLASDEEIKAMQSQRGNGILAPLRPPVEAAEPK